jgi:hypothetical protein
MPGFLATLGTIFSGPTGKGLRTLGELGATGLGLAGNISADQQRAAAAKQAEANAKLTPQQLGTMVSGAEQPLNANLVQTITGNVNANMASQGLSEAPGLQAEAIAQALSGPELQSQQTALQLVLRKLGLPAEFASTIPQNSNLAPLMALLFKGSNPSTGGGGFPTTGPNLGQMGTPPIFGDTNMPFDISNLGISS